MAAIRLNMNIREDLATAITKKIFKIKNSKLKKKCEACGDLIYNIIVGKHDVDSMPKGFFKISQSAYMHFENRENNSQGNPLHYEGTIHFSEVKRIPDLLLIDMKNLKLKKLVESNQKLYEEGYALGKEHSKFYFDLINRLKSVSNVKILEEKFPEAMEFLLDEYKTGNNYPLVPVFDDISKQLKAIEKEKDNESTS